MKNILKFLLFLVSIVMLSTTVFFNSSGLFFSNILLKAESDSKLFLRMMTAENHYFSNEWGTEESILSQALELSTNINLKDARSFIFDEIPGLFAMVPDIIVAGEGSDFTNLPVESSPPIEEILKDRNIKEGSLDELEKPDPPSEGEKPEKKTVFIYHTHSRESFVPHLEDSTSANTAQHKDINITLVGKKLAEELEKRGIGTVVDETDVPAVLYERKWTYGDSYAVSREVVQEAISNSKDLVYFMDIHRDSGAKNATTIEINGKLYGKLYFIIGENNKNYKKNEALAMEIHRRIEEKYPGLSKGIYKKSYVFNQDLSPNSMLIEIGGHQNRLEELYNTAEVLAEIFAEFYWEDAVEVNK